MIILAFLMCAMILITSQKPTNFWYNVMIGVGIVFLASILLLCAGVLPW